jgi:hypothetical protein
MDDYSPAVPTGRFADADAWVWRAIGAEMTDGKSRGKGKAKTEADSLKGMAEREAKVRR